MYKKQIFIVDDDLDFCRVTAFRLKKLGYDVLTANDGRKALFIIEECRPDLILMDINIMEA